MKDGHNVKNNNPTIINGTILINLSVLTIYRPECVLNQYILVFL
jgi:hypothetical protein